MGISLTKKKYLIWLTILTVATGLLVYLIIRLFFPEHYFNWYPAIPFYFYIFGWYYIYMFDMSRKYTPGKTLSIYMGMKVVKMLLSMLLILFYMLFVKIQKEDFIVVFFLFYLFSLMYESFFFYYFEHNQKKKINNE